MILNHKTSHMGQFSYIEMYTSSERLLNTSASNIWPRYNYLKIWNMKLKHCENHF